MMRTCFIPLLALAIVGCHESSTSPVAASDAPSLPLFNKGGAPANAVPFSIIGDCTGVTVIDPGTVEVRNGIRFERGLVADCIVTGDIAGVIRFTRSSTLRNGDGPFTDRDGPVWGTTTIMVEEFFGETGFEGTFTGPYHTDWQNLLSGELTINRRGTGDFQGLNTVGVGLSENFGFIIKESGLIHGPSGRP